MKPLELTVYPLRDKVGRNARPGFIVGKRAVSVAEAHRMVTAKRFTDAELAADYWGLRAMVDEAQLMHGTLNPEGVRVRGQVDILLRFATLPHYDQEEATA